MKTVKETIMFVIVVVLLLFAAFNINLSANSIERPGMDCPKCGSPATLVIERTSDAVDCMCADCKTKFSILDAPEDGADRAYDEFDEDSVLYDDTLEEEWDVEIRQ